jgi:hypothetical protein
MPPKGRGTKRKRNNNNNNGKRSENANNAPKSAPKSALKRANSVKKNRRASFSNTHGHPLAFASKNFSLNSAVAHDPAKITKPSTHGAVYAPGHLIAYLSHPAVRYQHDRIGYLNYVIGMVVSQSSTEKEMIAKIEALPESDFTKQDKEYMMKHLERSISPENDL